MMPLNASDTPGKPARVSFESPDPSTRSAQLVPTSTRFAPPPLPVKMIMHHDDRPNIESEPSNLIIDWRHGTHGEQDQEPVPTLESLMEIHTPLDLSGQIDIPDSQHPIYGGLAVVYTGFWRDRKVHLTQEAVFAL
jgi:hypothetical protein